MPEPESGTPETGTPEQSCSRRLTEEEEAYQSPDPSGASPQLPGLRRSERSSLMRKSLEKTIEIRKVRVPTKKKPRSSMTGRTPPLNAQKHQGASASKEAAPPKTTMDDLKGLILGVDSKLVNMGTRIDEVEAKLDDRLNDVTEDVANIRQQMSDQESDLPRVVEAVVVGLVDRVVSDKLKGWAPQAGPHQKAGAPSAPNPKEERYWVARRSLRMWPLEGDRLAHAVHVFLLSRLGFNAAFVNGMGPISGTRTGAKKLDPIRDEWEVVFSTKEVRGGEQGARRNQARGTRLPAKEFQIT